MIEFIHNWWFSLLNVMWVIPLVYIGIRKLLGPREQAGPIETVPNQRRLDSNAKGHQMFTSRPVKLLLGVVTILPVVYMAYFIAVFFYLSDSPDSPYDHDFMGILFNIWFVNIALIFVLFIIYVVHVFRTPQFTEQVRLLWLIAFFFGGIFAMIIYWFLCVWRDPSPSSGQA